jgi:hypothetical protein
MRADALVNPSPPLGTLNAAEFREMWQGIPIDLFIKIAYRQLQRMVFRIDQLWEYITELVELTEELPQNTKLDVFKGTALFKHIKSKLDERHRKSKWREMHYTRLDDEIGEHWMQDLDPGLFKLLAL